MNKSPVLRLFFVMLSAGLSVQGMVNKTQSFDGEEDGTFICNHFCGAKDNETELISPPRFNQSCIPEEIRNTSIYYTEKGSDHVVIKWTDPIARDGDDNSSSVIQVKGIKNGGNFTGALLGKTHTIVYIATDTDGLTDTCFFNFTVIVPSCSKLGNVQNGRYTCTNGTAPGSSCMFECHDGFKTTGTGNATCGYFSEPRQSRQSPIWKNVQQCKRIKCGIPADPENGRLTCTNITYQTVCNVNCNHGYTAFGPKNIICQANGNWSKATVCISHAPNVTECSPSSCNGHMCLLNDNGTFFCNCSLGWSGPLCENPPDMCAGNICMNGGVCENLNISYTCSCQLGYSGSLCQVSPVEGNWSDWSRWSKCSVTCGVGVRLRNRSCDNPPPDIHGKVCQGSYTESSYCENDKCEECPALKQTNESLSFYECKTDTDTGLKTCNITCKNGTIPVLRLEGFQTRCGHETNYYWVPGNVQVPCVVPKVPEVFELETEITYNSSIPKEQQPEVEDQVRKNINDTSCIQSGYCNTTMNFIPNQVGDYTETKLILTFLRNLDYIANNTGFVDQSVLHELQKVVSDLESTADYLRAENVFNVNTSGGLIQADESSLRLEGFINCTKGHIYVNGVCAGCPDSTSKKSHRCEFCPNRFFQLLRRQKRSQTTDTSESVDEEICAFGKCAAGTFRENNKCVFCPKGFYQEFSGKNACIICPHGKTTHTYGSNHIEHCFHHEVLRQGSYVAVIAGSVCAVFALIVSVVGTTIAYRECSKKESTNGQEHGCGVVIRCFNVFSPQHPDNTKDESGADQNGTTYESGADQNGEIEINEASGGFVNRAADFESPQESGNQPVINVGSGATPSGINVGGGATPNGTNVGSGATPNGTNVGSGATPNGTNVGSGATPNGTNVGSGATPNETNVGSGATPNGINGSGATPNGTNVGSGATPNGTNVGSGATPNETHVRSGADRNVIHSVASAMLEGMVENFK